MGNRANRRLDEITANILIVGVDVAKAVQWARFVDGRGEKLGRRYGSGTTGRASRPL